MTFDCPADCGDTFASKNGAVMHAVNKSDEEHSNINDKPTAYSKLQESSSEPTQDPDDTSRLTPEMPNSDENGHSPPEPDTVDCPNCGTDLNHSEDEIKQFIDDHGAAYCDSCSYQLEVTQ